MDTKPLERFAAEARRELLTAVEAQTSAVLAAGSVARSERAETVKRLEAEIAKHGRKHVIDKVAYTWFNRLIALRYMDVHGYTSAGVVSPAEGHEHGQPEILADAKSGHLDTEVITSPRVQEGIMGLLDGTRRSTDAEGEAYALLLTEYCRHWNKAMPFMFEREGDYTELLVPAGLLADGGILARARVVLTKDVCEDVEVIGWLYQFYISERKQEIFDSGARRGASEIPAATQLFTPHWIVRYLVENSLGRLWVLNRPASRLVDQMDYYIAPVDEETDFLKISGPEELTVIDPACGSGHMLTYAFDLFYAIYEEEGYAPSEIPSLILTHNLHGTEIDPRAGALAAFALTMKARNKDRRFFTRNAEPKICVIEPISFAPDELDFLVTKSGDRLAQEAFWNQFRDADTLGSLIQPSPSETTHAAGALEGLKGQEETLFSTCLDQASKAVRQAGVLSRKYSVVIANPPYMGSKNMTARLADFVTVEFPGGKQDLYGCFVLRAMELVSPGGMVAKIIGDTWMSIVTFKGLREEILAGHSFDSFVHLRDVSNHPDAFGANAAFVLSMTNVPGKSVPFVRLTPLGEEKKRRRLLEAINKSECGWRFTASAEDFTKIPGSPIAYWLGEELLGVVEASSRVDAGSDVRQGLSPADKPRFMRAWWEVSWRRSAMDSMSVAKWFPYNKGGGFRKWFGNVEHVINWQGDGAEIRAYPNAAIRNSSYYLRESITWTKVSSGRPSFRYVPEGYMFDGAAGALFPHQSEELLPLLGVLNSSVIERVLEAYAPTLNFTEGNIASLPTPKKVDAGRIRGMVEELVALARADWDSDETSWGFTAPYGIAGAQRTADVFDLVRTRASGRDQRTHSLEVEVERIVAEGFGLQEWRVAEPDDLVDVVGPIESPLEVPPVPGMTHADIASRLVSYAVGCMFGRYSLDAPGLILADHDATLQDYLAKVPLPTFMPDADNVLPFVDDGWFEDDIVERFRQFLRTAFGADHFEENLRFVEESLGVNTIRDYFIAKSNPSGKTVAKSRFYEDHIQRYKKRPIYWMLSSPRGSFNALIYMHRYTPSTVSTVLNEYLREYRAKLEIALQQAEEAAVGGASAKEQKEADRMRKVLAELRDYEHDILYPLDIQRMDVDLDDGVLVNYLRFGPAFRDCGLEKDRTKVESWTWPKNRLEPSK